MDIRRFAAIILLFTIIISNNYYGQEQLPHLKDKGNAKQLIVNGKPFLMLAGELGNSTASSMTYLDAYWKKFNEMHINTILAPVYWELIEPEEGKFDFELVEELIIQARKYDIKLVMLWFGSWKNSMSCYAPSWVKKDHKRFPRAKDDQNIPQEILTPFEKNNLNADLKAFTELMKFIKMIDSEENTVIMIQVENEIGMIPSARDYYSKANESFNSEVPSELIDYLIENKNDLIPEFKEFWKQNGFKTSGNWEEVFGKSLKTDELFMSWHFSKYTNAIASAGKDIYPLPMFVNAALIREGHHPGQYPSAGPLPHLFDIWKAGGNAIDFFSPDVYFPEFTKWTGLYARQGNTLFIPEASFMQGVANAFYAVAEHNALGYSPFSIESITDSESSTIPGGYKTLSQLSDLILKNQGTENIRGILLDNEDESTSFVLGNYVFNIRHEYSWKYARRIEGPVPRFGGLIIKINDDEFVIAGCGIIITFQPSEENDHIAGILNIEEGEYSEGKWIPGRVLNGDQSHQGRHVHFPGQKYGIQKVKLYRYK